MRPYVPGFHVAEMVGRPMQLSLSALEAKHEKREVYRFPSGRAPDKVYRRDDGSEVSLIEVTSPLKQRLESYKFAVDYMLAERALFITIDGYVGLGPETMQKQDLVVVFEGAKTLFILRPIGTYRYEGSTTPKEESGQVPMYQVVGECYLHGWMNGGAMGPTFQGPPIDVILVWVVSPPCRRFSSELLHTVLSYHHMSA